MDSSSTPTTSSSAPKGKSPKKTDKSDKKKKPKDEKSQEKTEIPEEKKPSWTLLTAGSYALVMLVIGLPLWWKTTTVHREPLPFEEMSKMFDYYEENLKLPLNIHLKGFSIEKMPNQDGINSDVRFNFINSQLPVSDVKILNESNDLPEMDQRFCKIESSQSNITIFKILRKGIFDKYKLGLIMGNCRTAYFLTESKQDNDAIPAISKSLLNLESAFASNNHFPLSYGYDILFSLLIPEPEVLNPEWNVEQELQGVVNSLLSKLDHYAEFTVRSQILYYIQLNIRPTLNSKGLYEVSRDQLPLIINPVEAKLTSFVSQHPVLNFLVYTSPCDEHPLVIAPEEPNSNAIPTNSFVVPQWGGIHLYNGPCKQKEGQKEVPKLPMNTFASVFLTQFRTLMGFKPEDNDGGILKLKNALIRDWEVDLAVRNRLKSLILTSANTLKSLGDLLDKITNIVVTAEVQIEVEKSVESLKMAFEEAIRGNLEKAQFHALSSYKSSEIAFHHHTNLAQLYFPDDQKYAIYIPLFLPIGIPVLFSIYSILLSFKKKK